MRRTLLVQNIWRCGKAKARLGSHHHNHLHMNNNIDLQLINLRELSTQANNANASASTTSSSASTPASASSSSISLDACNDSDTFGSSENFISKSELKALASKRSTALSLAQMYRYASSDVHTGQRLRNAQFLHRELQIRLAQRVIELQTLPCGLGRTGEILDVIHTYLRYLQRLSDFQCPQTDEEEMEFTQLLQSFVLDRKSIPQAVSRGVNSLRDHRRETLTNRRFLEMEVALSRFFTARVGLRFLTEHHVLSAPYCTNELKLYIQDEDNDFDAVIPFRGCIQKDCNPVEEVRKVAADVMRKCRKKFDKAPEIDIVDCSKNSSHGDVFTYVPMHLQYILTELLKNSCRYTLKSHIDQSNIPPVKVVVVKGAEDVTIKISDVGGGIQRSALESVWSFAHSTQRNIPIENDQFDINAFTGGRLRGFGLPLARVYARYFGGDLTLKSMEGYGVDVYVHLPVLGIECENLPESVILSPGNQDSSLKTRKQDVLAALYKRAL